MSRVVIAQYRYLLKSIKPLRISEQNCYLNLPPTANDFIKFRNLPSDHDAASVQAAFPKSLQHVASQLQSRFVDAVTLIKLIKKEFRAPRDDVNAAIDSGFEGMRALGLQLKIREVTSIAVTQAVRVIVTAIYDPADDFTDHGHVFHYRIVIENMGSDTVQVLGRHWLFKSGEDFQDEVPKFSPGVVGEMPIIVPGSAFQYMSRTDLKYAEGTMEGLFLVLNQRTGKHFELIVPKCNLRPITFN